MSNNILNEYKNLFEKKYIKVLNLTDDEKLSYLSLIKLIVQEQDACDELPADKCINDTFTHTRLIRDENNNIIISSVPCSKHKTMNNWLFDDFLEDDKKDLSMNKFCNLLVDEMWSNIPSENVLDISLSYSEKLRILRDQKFYSNSKLSIINDYLNTTFKVLKKDKLTINVRGVYVYGNYGVGKTLMLHTFLNALQKEGFKCVFAKASTLSKKLKNNFDKNNIVNEEIIQMYKDCDILVFDDIGVTDVSEWFINQVLFDILDTRYNKKKLAYFSSNFSFYELAKKLKTVSKLSSVDIGRFVDRIKALTNDTEIKIVEKNHRYDSK